MKNHQTQPWRLGTIASFGEFSDDVDDIMLTTIAIHNCNCINPRRKSNTPSPTQDALRHWEGADEDGGLGDSCSRSTSCVGNASPRCQDATPWESFLNTNLKCNNQMGWGNVDLNRVALTIWSVERIWRTRNEGRVDVDFGKRNFGEQMWEGEWRNGFPLAKIQEGDHGNGEQLHPYPKGGERGALSETDSDRNILDGGLCLIRY